MKAAAIQDQRRISRGSLVLLLWIAGIVTGEEVNRHGRITHESEQGVYVNIGTDQGLRQGLLGTAELGDGRFFEFEVLRTARQSALLRLMGDRGGRELLGRAVDLIFQTPLRDDPKKDVADQDAFIPLLAPIESEVRTKRAGSVSHGRIQIRQMLQTDSGGGSDYSVTRIGSSGSIDRIDGSDWRFGWSGDVRYRDGDAYASADDYRDADLDVYRAAFESPLGQAGLFRFGRFLPQELPGAGFVDGLQGQIGWGDLRLGLVGGLKPNRYDLDASADEPMMAGYATIESGHPDQAYYTGTLGLLSSLYDGQTDRMALLVDQRGSFGPGLTLYSTAAVDFDTGAAQTRDGTRLTRLDVTAVSRLSSWLTIQGGVDHWERPDHLAERDLLPVDDERFFDDGYWRYWLGSSQNLPGRLRLYEEVALVTSDTTDDSALWRVRLTQSEPFGWTGGSATVTVYNLAAYADDGYGIRASAYLPFDRGKLIVQPAGGFRLLQTGAESGDITLSYLSLRLYGRFLKDWTLFGGATYSHGDEVNSTLFELGLRYAW